MVFHADGNVVTGPQPRILEDAGEPIGRRVKLAVGSHFPARSHDVGGSVWMSGGVIPWVAHFVRIAIAAAPWVDNYPASVEIGSAYFERFAVLMANANWTLDEATVLLAAHSYPALDCGATLTRIDDLAKTVTGSTLDDLLNALFADGGFAGNSVDYYDPDNSYLHRVLDRRLGIPISLAVVAIEVGRRCGVPLSGVGFPGHFLLRDDRNLEVFVDPFGGRRLTESECVVWFHRQHPAGASWNRNYLQPVDNATIITRMISNLVAVYQQRKDLSSVRWLMKLRCALPNSTSADQATFARLMAPLN